MNKKHLKSYSTSDINTLLEQRGNLRMDIANKRVELMRIEDELKIARHKPSRHMSCKDMIDKLHGYDEECPIVAYENNAPKKIIKAIRAANHIRLELSSNPKDEYEA